jgi:hypothetical protein
MDVYTWFKIQVKKGINDQGAIKNLTINWILIKPKNQKTKKHKIK